MKEINMESVIKKLKALRMTAAAENLAQILQRAETQNLPPIALIEAMLDIEEEVRQEKPDSQTLQTIKAT